MPSGSSCSCAKLGVSNHHPDFSSSIVIRNSVPMSLRPWKTMALSRCAPPFAVLGRTGWPSRPGELHPEPLTDPDMTLSRHPARAARERLSPFIQVGGFLPLPVDPTWIGPPTPFAPLRLQQLRHYCEVVRP